MRTFLICTLSLVLWLASAGQASGRQWTLRLDLRGQTVEGAPIKWSDSRVHLVARDGRLWDFAPSEAKNFQKKSDYFTPYSQSEIRGELLREFGPRYDVSGTGHYLVVHPAGQRDRWAQRFEDLHRSMVHYFAARGFSLHEPQFPLVAIVLPSRQAYLRYGSAHGVRLVGTLGTYLLGSNRIVLYDLTAGRPDNPAWFMNAETIIHEAAHQTSYNTGLTSRFAPTPVWLDEGIATVFEAPGVWNARRFPEMSSRINRSRLESYRRAVAGPRRPGTLEQLVASDQLFRSQPETSYALSWALTFYLAERETSKLSRYVRQTASRPPFHPYPTQERLQDFTRVFGENMKMLEVRVDRFVAALK